MVTGHAIHFDWEIFNVSHPGYVVLIISDVALLYAWYPGFTVSQKESMGHLDKILLEFRVRDLLVCLPAALFVVRSQVNNLSVGCLMQYFVH